MITALKAATALLAAALLVLISVLPGAAQEADIAFSNEKIDSYGFPELHVTFNGSGFDMPETVEAGYHVVVLEPGPGIAAYVDFMQVPEGIPHDEAVALALEAAAMDVPSKGWAYGGGSYAFMDRTDRAVTADDFAAWFASTESGTPVTDPFKMTWVGYIAITSPRHATWIELDLEPGTYTATSWVIDPETQMPALLLGRIPL
jgi:hypothetical protein